jgi:hypothetical protein
MSLVSQLTTGRLSAWCAENLPGTADLVQAIPAATQGVQPVRPEGRPPLEHYAAVGGMFGQRLAFLIEPAPPYAAILGAQRAGHLGRADAVAAAAAFTTHRQLGEHAGRADSFRTTPTGLWDTEADQELTGVPAAAANPAGREFFVELAGKVAALPVGGFTADPREFAFTEDLAMLTSWEDMYRAGHMPDLELDGPALIQEWKNLLVRTSTGRALDTARSLVANPAAGRWGYAAPTLVHRWAEADVLLGPDRTGGHTLLDIKTVTSISDQQKVARWLWQILAYAWLDVADRWRITRVGLWLARHGVIVSWPVEQAAEILLGRTARSWGGKRAVRNARREFLAHCNAAIREDGGQAPQEITLAIR